MAIIKEDNGDAAADVSTQYTIEPGDVFQGTVDTAGDKDWIKIELSAGTIYDIRIDGLESDQFRLYHPSGIGWIYGPYLFSYSTLFRALETGTYFIGISRPNYDDPFNYEISFVENPLSTVSYDEIAAYLIGNPNEKLLYDVEPGGTLTADITALNSAGQQLARWALEAWTYVTGIKFEFVDDDTAHITFDDSESGIGFSSSTTSNGVRISSRVNVGSDWLITFGSGMDSFTFYAYLHEIGHALGLDHPGPYSGLFPITIAKLFGNDTYQTTVMSYFRQDRDNIIDASFAYPVTPMTADIIAIHDLYGKPVDINPGDTVYGYGANLDGYLGELFRLWAEGENPFALIDTGMSANPAFSDLDGDGDLDLAFGSEEGAIHYYENTGTATEPSYTQRSGADNPLYGLGVDSINIPRFIDLDNDGDPDLVLGNDKGSIRYYENTGARTEPRFTEQFDADNPLDGLGVVSQTFPIFTDLDGDDDPDFIVQNLYGVVLYFENTGNAANPRFTQRTGDTNPLESITLEPGSLLSFADLDNDGDPDLIIGNGFNLPYYFENTGNATSPNFTQRTGVANPLEIANAGYINLPVFIDLDNDNDLDFIENMGHGVFIYFENIGTNTKPSFTITTLVRPITLTLSDSDGIDTLDLRTDTTDQRVDLRQEGISDVYGLVGNLIIARNTLIENFTAGSGDDVVAGNDAANHLKGGDGNDELRGNGGNDILEGGAGADRLDGGGGMDWVSYRGSNTAVTIDFGDGTLTGGHAEGDIISSIENVIGSGYGDVLEGNSGANWLHGGPGNDEISGNDGNDLLEGGPGADRLTGGAGADTASYAQSGAGVVVRLHAGEVRGGDAEGDTFAAMVTAEYIDSNGDIQQETVPDIEHLLGSAHADTLAGDSRANRLEGGGGDDRLYGGPGGGDDVLEGGPGADALYGGRGDDVLEGGPDADTLRGGPGSDTAAYTQSVAGVEVRLHDGTVRGGHAEGDDIADIENARGSAHADILEGDEGANRLEGGTGDDVLEGGAGTDWLDGGAGTDWLSYAGSDGPVSVRLYDGYAARGHAEGDTISGFENLRGSDYSDALAGSGRANRLEGGAGDDRMGGGSGDDILDGGAGADRLDGGPGTDWLSYQGSDGPVSVRLYDGYAARGHAEGDTISGFENLRGSDYSDALAGSGGANRLEGGAGDDRMRGAGGDDILDGGPGADRLDGGAGSDTVVYRYSDAAITANLSNGTLMGGHAEGDVFVDIESIVGSAHSDTLVGNDGVNRLDGEDGDDVLEGGAGADRLDGGAGTDTLIYRNSNTAVTVNLSTGTSAGGHAEGDTVVNIENIQGSSYDDVLIGDSSANHLDGGDGNDELRGGDGKDRIFGGGGNDLLEGGEGIDSLDGGPGTDTVTYENSKYPLNVDLIIGGANNYNDNHEREPITNIENVIGSHHGDSLAGNGGANELYGRDGVDWLYGREGDDRLFGEEGDDRLTGGEGADLLNGGEGVDRVNYFYSPTGVIVNLEEGTAEGGHAEGDLLVDIEDIWGSLHADILAGDNGPNRIYGVGGNDEVNGNGGDDVLVSGSDPDLLNGGPGMDTVSYDRSQEGVTVNLREGIAEGGNAEGDVFIDIENIEGSSHDDMLVGDDEANRLYGSFGDNTLQGGGGADRFIFDFIGNNETVLDFTDDEDLIDLTVFWNISGFDDLTITSGADGVTIDLRAYRGGTILLEGFDIANLDASDFIF